MQHHVARCRRRLWSFSGLMLGLNYGPPGGVVCCLWSELRFNILWIREFVYRILERESDILCKPSSKLTSTTRMPFLCLANSECFVEGTRHPLATQQQFGLVVGVIRFLWGSVNECVFCRIVEFVKRPLHRPVRACRVNHNFLQNKFSWNAHESTSFMMILGFPCSVAFHTNHAFLASSSYTGMDIVDKPSGHILSWQISTCMSASSAVLHGRLKHVDPLRYVRRRHFANFPLLQVAGALPA